MKKKILKVLGNLVFLIFLAGGILATVGSVMVTLYMYDIYKETKPISKETLSVKLTSNFYDSDGIFIKGKFQENRSWIEYDDIPKDYIDALVATEDKNFFTHQGFDTKAMIRAIVANYRSGSVEQGASTITLQLAKNLFIDPKIWNDKGKDEKVLEFFYALKLESLMSKEEIFEYYANTVNFGNGAYGLKAASLSYFGKEPKDLTQKEAAVLAGLPQNPLRHNPFYTGEEGSDVEHRTNQVINALYMQNYINEDEKEKLLAEEVVYAPQTETFDAQYGFFIDTATTEAEDIISSLSAQNEMPGLLTGGYKVYTTMDRKGQEIMEAQFKDSSNFIPNKDNQVSQAAAILIEQGNGEIKAVMGGREYNTEKPLNRAFWHDRQPGSTIKPIAVYAPAIELGLDKSDTYIDGPIDINGYKPKTSSKGSITIGKAVASSTNSIAVQVLNDITPKKGYEFANRLGLNLDETDQHNISLALGGTKKGVSIAELSTAFGSFGNNGIMCKSHSIRKIVDRNEKTIYEYDPKQQCKQVMSPTVAYKMTDMLQGVVSGGTATRANISGVEEAGKTGTVEQQGTGGNRDVLFVGYTPKYTMGIWMGFDKVTAQTALKGQYGGNYPAALWKKIMDAYLSPEDRKLTFIKPDPFENIEKQFNKKSVVKKKVEKEVVEEEVVETEQPVVDPTPTPTPTPDPTPTPTPDPGDGTVV